ncbi:MAG: VOC family protein [bacterium]|nr:VOC family protein [bacterium]
MQKLTPCLWFDNNAEEAMNFYVSVFKDSKINHIDYYPDESLDEHFKGMSGKVINGEFELSGHPFICLDGGPLFNLNSSISFILNFDPSMGGNAAKTIEEYWHKLSENGRVLMPFQEYPFSKKYGWIQDKYGVTWQLMTTDPAGEDRPFITPSLMFAGQKTNRAEEAIDFYTSVFLNSQKGSLAHYTEDSGTAKKGSLMFGDFRLNGTWMAAMDSSVEQDVTFNEAISLTIDCQDQAELGYYWERLSAVPEAEQCGWCKDKFGVSWQIIPRRLNELLTDKDKAAAGRAMQAMMKMHKLDVAELEKAFNG